MENVRTKKNTLIKQDIRRTKKRKIYSTVITKYFLFNFKI